jgi:hypothetical protein
MLRGTGTLRILAMPWLIVILGSTLVSGQSVNVLTWHNDIGRTGQNTNETALTYSTVTKSKFGKILFCQFGR